MSVHKTVRQQSITVCLFSKSFNENSALYKNVLQKGVKQALL